MKHTLFALAGFWMLTYVDPTHAAEATPSHQQREAIRNKGDVPARAIEVYEIVIRTGKGPKGYVGGRVWENRERRLPLSGNYHEYDVNPKVRGVNRGAERIIVDLNTKQGWYTADHYRTFIPIRR